MIFEHCAKYAQIGFALKYYSNSFGAKIQNLSFFFQKILARKFKVILVCANLSFHFIFQPKFLMMPKTSLPDNVQQFQKVPKNVKIAHQNHFA